MISKDIFHAKIAEDTYLISTTKAGPDEDEKSLLPGKPTTNSYLIVGKEKAYMNMLKSLRKRM